MRRPDVDASVHDNLRRATYAPRCSSKVVARYEKKRARSASSLVPARRRPLQPSYREGSRFPRVSSPWSIVQRSKDHLSSAWRPITSKRCLQRAWTFQASLTSAVISTIDVSACAKDPNATQGAAWAGSRTDAATKEISGRASSRAHSRPLPATTNCFPQWWAT